MTDTLTFKTFALAGVAALALLLWSIALPQLWSATSQVGSSTYDATVISCPSGPSRTSRCEVALERGGAEATVPLARVGFVQPAVGDRFPVRIDASGRAEMSGLRNQVEAVLLLVLAVLVTDSALRWWRRVLQHGTPEPTPTLHPLSLDESWLGRAGAQGEDRRLSR